MKRKAACSLACLAPAIAHMTAFVVINVENPGLNAFTFQTQKGRRLSVSQAGRAGRQMI